MLVLGSNLAQQLTSNWLTTAIQITTLFSGKKDIGRTKSQLKQFDESILTFSTAVLYTGNEMFPSFYCGGCRYNRVKNTDMNMVLGKYKALLSLILKYTKK